MIISTGTLTGVAPHVLQGRFSLSTATNGTLFETSSDFFFDGSPAPGFALHSQIPTDASDPILRQNMLRTRFLDIPGGTVNVTGPQVGLIPADADLEQMNCIVLWCFAIPFILGYGQITPSKR